MHNSRSLASAWSRTAATAALGSLVIAGTSACSDTLRDLGPNPVVAQSNADQLFGSVGMRFSQVERTPQYDRARVRLAESALVPSRVFNDTTVWPVRPTPQIRLLYISGDLGSDGRYLLETRSLL
ncbi:MAG TPA: hypothetical protein VL383_04910, partial [Gemmatimonadaceae bacterium]|nr:hypothetical protein [Gemmatimonadaceae bacterium]